jgi:hypothetical protein
MYAHPELLPPQLQPLRRHVLTPNQIVLFGPVTVVYLSIRIRIRAEKPVVYAFETKKC